MHSVEVEKLIQNFMGELEQLVRAEVRAEIAATLESCLAQMRTAPARGRRPGRPRALPRSSPAPRRDDRSPSPPPAAAPLAGSATSPKDSGKRRGWTRESVVAELATWLLTGTVIEAAFLSKHGKPGLVAAARKHFGRFDAALNAANVHLARMHPEGPPTANRRQRYEGARMPASESGASKAPPSTAASS